jgi:epoxyqueuosine reductase
VPGTVRVITARMDYLPADVPEGWQQVEWHGLSQARQGMVSVYARGRDYHKVLRARLQKLADVLAQEIGPAHALGARVFTDSAPVLEVELASRSGIGWRGKHSLLLSRQAGSMFFLGEIYVDVPLPLTNPEPLHCGTCRACMDICPTQAIVAEGLVDARRCISYLTIEHSGPIPVELRAPMGNRIYGCDDCQLACPWNKFAARAQVADFDRRPVWSEPDLLVLWGWGEATFLRLTEGSAMRRIGFTRWQRNLAVALGNALRGGVPWQGQAVAALQAWTVQPPEGVDVPLVAQHVQWALDQVVQAR